MPRGAANIAAASAIETSASRPLPSRPPTRHHVHEQFRSGPGADRDRPVVASAQPNAVSGFVTIVDFNGLSRFQVVPLDETKKILVLIDDARDRDRRFQGACQQRLCLL